MSIINEQTRQAGLVVALATKLTDLRAKADVMALCLSTSMDELSINDEGYSLYIEISDYDEALVSDYVKENELKTMILHEYPVVDFAKFVIEPGVFCVKCTKENAAKYIAYWMNELAEIAATSFGLGRTTYITTDVGMYTWVHFAELFGGTIELQKFIPSLSYIPMDLATLFMADGMDPDCSREEVMIKEEGQVIMDTLLPKEYKDISKLNAMYIAMRQLSIMY